MFGGNAFALSVSKTCDDCYKCVQYSGSSCVKCEYDANYCTGVGLCEMGKVWNETLGECVCASLCVGTQDPDTCECVAEELTCESGEYVDDSGLIAKCVSCPTGDFNDPYTSSGSGLVPVCGLHSENGGVDGKTNCYYQAVASISLDGINYCKYSDETGTFVYTQDCHYNPLDEVIVVPGGSLSAGDAIATP